MRIAAACPARALAAKSGSAICPRTTPTRSHCPSASAWSACSGLVIRPAPSTGMSTAARIAAGTYRACPGAVRMLATTRYRLAVATPIVVLM